MRLIDLHVDWLLQYASESVVFDSALYPGVESRQGQVEGYLQTTRAAVLSCYRRAEDWQTRSDPWASLDELITRIEAEFPGRLLIGPDDFDRWQEDRDGLTWGLIGVEGFDSLIRSEVDLSHLARLFDRGVRLFQPVYMTDSLLGGSSVVGDDRGLTELGRAFLEAILPLARDGSGPRPVFDLAHLNPRTMSDALTWFESDPARASRMILAYSHGSLVHPGFEKPRGLTMENLTRLRSLGGFIGLGVSPPFFQSSSQLKDVIDRVAEIPFQGRPGHEGIGIGTDFLGVSQTLPELANAGQVVEWVQSQFERPFAKDLLHDNALTLIVRATGAKLHS